jgi:hypothetical protein
MNALLHVVATLVLGSRPRQGLAKVRTKSEARITFHTPRNVGECEGMNPHTPKWILILGVWVQWISKFLEDNFKGQNSLDWQVSYIIENLLELRCPKWAHMTHLDT